MSDLFIPLGSECPIAIYYWLLIASSYESVEGSLLSNRGQGPPEMLGELIPPVIAFINNRGE